MKNIRREFIQFAIETKVIRFGEFVTKAGRLSPYFFNTGLFSRGGNLGHLGNLYAQTLLDSGIEFDMLFGPAYKGITLASATAIALAEKGKDVPFAFNRKEAKDHGEGGNIVGSELSGRVVIVDDVISAGTSVGESVELIRQAGAKPVAVLIAMDRMERAGNDGNLSVKSAVQEISTKYGIPVLAIADLNDLFDCINEQKSESELVRYAAAIDIYRKKYGVL